MNSQYRRYESNPYQKRYGDYGEGGMSILRSTLILCATALLCMAAYLLYHFQKDRYSVVASGESLMIYDYRRSTITICDTQREKCRIMYVEGGMQARMLPNPSGGSSASGNKLTNSDSAAPQKTSKNLGKTLQDEDLGG